MAKPTTNQDQHDDAEEAKIKPPKCGTLLVGLLNRDRDPKKLSVPIQHGQCCHLLSLCFSGVITGAEGKLGSQQLPANSSCLKFRTGSAPKSTALLVLLQWHSTSSQRCRVLKLSALNIIRRLGSISGECPDDQLSSSRQLTDLKFSFCFSLKQTGSSVTSAATVQQ